jgi:L-fuculose-phosphate aldolase
MKPVISARDIQELIRTGADLSQVADGAILTPSAREMLRDALESGPTRQPVAAKPAAPVAPAAKPGAPMAAPKASASSAEIERYFNSPEIHKLKEEICDIGKRLWGRAYVDGNGGNISIRVSDELVLCTPTLISKGFMKPEDMCFTDMDGNQKAGTKKRTSEVLMHLQIMKRQARAKSVVHCHPPHATAFAVAGVRPPNCMIPELEVFVGEIPIAEYATPGTPELGKRIADLAMEHNTILMANHGVVAWSHLGVEDAYWKMEIIEAYCRTVVVAAQLGTELKTFSTPQLRDLLKIKDSLGIVDRRIGLKECELCDNPEWRPGVSCAATVPESTVKPDGEAEKVVQAVTDMLMERLNKGN